MQFCFIRDSVSLVMPVTPGNYQWSVGKNMETINISQLGDVYRPGGRSRFSGSFEFLLPAQEYPWMEASARPDPQYYLDYLTAWARDKKTVRMVITGTEINALVYIEEVTQQEKDGTGDRYATVAVREYEDLEAAEVANPNVGTGNSPGTLPTAHPGWRRPRHPVTVRRATPSCGAIPCRSSAAGTTADPLLSITTLWLSTTGSKIPI